MYYFLQVKVKVEKMDEDEKETNGKPEGEEKMEEKMKEEKKEEEEKKKAPSDPEIGRLVMTVDGQQKQLTFTTMDLLSTATMMDGDKVSSYQLLQH